MQLFMGNNIKKKKNTIEATGGRYRGQTINLSFCHKIILFLLFNTHLVTLITELKINQLRAYTDYRTKD